MLSCFMDPITVLVISNPSAGFLPMLDRLPGPVKILAGDTEEFLSSTAPEADVILTGFHDGSKLRTVLPIAQRLRWIHVLSAGVERILVPEVVASTVPMTNGRAVFGPALAEFALGAILYFAKDFRRLICNQQDGRWEQFDVSFIRGQRLGIVGYGGIGQETAKLAHAVGMKVAAIRRKQTCRDSLVERFFAPDALHEMLSLSDYVLISTPLTPETREMIGEAELNAMKRSAVLINVSRGATVVERALIAALRETRIRGAALDVFTQEPLPNGHAFYGLKNVLLSPHSADHTTGWFELAVERFIELFHTFRDGQPFDYVVDKQAGY